MTQEPRLRYIIILGLLTTLGPFTIDLYVPAFPQIREMFRVSDGFVQLTLAGTTFGFALGHLFVGTLSDHVGRRSPLLVATTLHVLASVGCALSSDIYTLWALRFLQGVGAAASSVVVRAIIRDQFEGRPLAIMLSRVGFVTTATPVLAPVIGAQLMLFTGWRGIFWVLAGFAAILLILTWGLVHETHPAESRLLQNRPLKQRLRALAGDRMFVAATLAGGMVYAAVYVYVAASALLFQLVYLFDPQQFSLIFMMTTLGLASGIRLNSYLVKRWPIQNLLLAATGVMTAASLAVILVSSLTDAPLGVLIALWVMMAATGVAFPNASALSLLNHKERAGTAASVYGAFSFTVSGLLSPVVGFIGVTSAIPTGIVLSVVSLAGMVGAYAAIRCIASNPDQHDGLLSGKGA